MKNKIFKAKYETFEFVTADVLLVGGGILVGTTLIDSSISTPLGVTLVAIGFFLGLRVLWKFSSDLKSTQIQIQKTMRKLKETEEKVFGFGGSTFSNSSGFDSLDNSVGELKREVEELKRKIDDSGRYSRF